MSQEGDRQPLAAKDRVTLLFRALPAQSRMSGDDKRQLRNFASALSEKAGHAGAFTCLITGDQEMRRLNRDFLGHDYPTDVLSFPAKGILKQASGALLGLPLPYVNLGEIAISLERAKAQAAEFGHTYFDELRVLLLHGFLHLTGLDHARDRGAMARAERKWRVALGLPPTLIARTRTARRPRK